MRCRACLFLQGYATARWRRLMRVVVCAARISFYVWAIAHWVFLGIYTTAGKVECQTVRKMKVGK